MLAIYKKEMRAYFVNPIGYIYMGVFLALSALVFCYTTFSAKSYDLSPYFYYMIFAFAILIPLLTMRSFAEERKMRTEQLLLTAPISIPGMVLGKYLAAFTMFFGSVLLSCINLIPLYIIGKEESALDPDGLTVKGPVTPEIVGSLLGVLLVGAVFIAIGILISSMTENQLSAAVVTIAVLAVMLILNMLNNVGSEEEGTRLINNYAVRYVIDWISVISRFTNLQYGILDWSAMLYYVSMIFIAIYLTVRVYERRRWA